MASQFKLTNKEPDIPEGCLVFTIDYDKRIGSGSRVFKAVLNFIELCENLDKEILGAIDPSMETVMILEDIERGSFKFFLRSILKNLDDLALKELDYKKNYWFFSIRCQI